MSGFLRIPPHGGHPCLWRSSSRYRAGSGLSPLDFAHVGRTRKTSSITSNSLGYYGGYLNYSMTFFDFGDKKGRQLLAHCNQSTV